jgi:hypothetical protein
MTVSNVSINTKGKSELNLIIKNALSRPIFPQTTFYFLSSITHCSEAFIWYFVVIPIVSIQ